MVFVLFPIVYPLYISVSAILIVVLATMSQIILILLLPRILWVNLIKSRDVKHNEVLGV